MSILNLISLLSGLALVLYGITLMGDGLNLVAGNKLELALKVEPLKDLIDGLCDEMRSHHIDRLQKGVCTLQNGFVFNDLLTNCERVGDHCSNIAVAMIELAHDVFDTHEYLDSLKQIKGAAFAACYEEFRSKYTL